MKLRMGMREIRTEIEIAAPVTKVWSILTDFDNWKEWNPIVEQESGVASPGSKLSMTMRCGMVKKVINICLLLQTSKIRGLFVGGRQ